MLMTIAALVTVLASAAGTTDTTFAVKPGARLEVHNFGGEIDVGVWDRNAVRIAADHNPAVRVMIERTGEVIEVSARARRAPRKVDYRIVVPKWMPLELSGVYTDVNVDGTHADVSAETVHGDVRVLGGIGVVRLSSLQGMVSVEGAKGRVEATALNDQVHVTDVDGDVWVDAVNGNVNLERIKARTVEASTVNGDVSFVGALLEGGRYRLASHQGDLILAIPDRSDAKVSIATFSGTFEADFPIEVVGKDKKHGKRFAFTLGNGSALLDLETFAGTVRLTRDLKVLQRQLRMAERGLLERQKKHEVRKAKAPKAPRPPRDPNPDPDEDEEE